MIDKISVAALIINWNGSDDTLELIHSLRICSIDTCVIDVIIIDNASDYYDFINLQEGIKNLDGVGKIVLRRNSINIGVPAAYNQAIQIIGIDYNYYLRLDNDIVMDANGLSMLIDGLERNRLCGVGLVGGNVKYFDRPFENNGGAVTIDLLRGVTNSEYPSVELVCDGVLGCIMLLDGDVVRRYSPDVFDSNLFICTDESELSLRARLDGIFTLYIAGQIGLHKSGVSTGKVGFLSNYYSARNWTIHRLYFLRGIKNKSLLFLRFFIDICRSILRGRWSYPIGLLSGFAISISRSIDNKIKHGK
jgi:GT2 family glycosyltransferase